MSSDLILTAALRDNLLSLQNAQKSNTNNRQQPSAGNVAQPQESAAPENLLSPQSLNNRANDLSRVLDGISVSIKTIEEASQGIQSIGDILSQAENTLQSLRNSLTGDAAEGPDQGDVQNAEALANNFREILGEIDRLGNESGVRGTNLLRGDDLNTVFNEGFSGTLTTEGRNVSTEGLGIVLPEFGDVDSIETALSAIKEALETVRSFREALKEDLSLIQERRDFTEGTIGSLNAGADDLGITGQSEEGANLLALQVRQALGETDASLASPAQKSVIKLF